MMHLAAVCEMEKKIQILFYHRRRDFERAHLRWKQEMEEILRTGSGEPYAEPLFPDINQIRKAVYKRV